MSSLKEEHLLYIDTREQVFRGIVAQLAKHEGFRVHEMALDFGDYETEHAVAERKTASDLLGSSKDGRLFRQLGKGLIKDKEYMLLITGTIEPVDAIIGLYASVLVRYPDYKVVWKQDFNMGIQIMLKWFKKIEEGASGKPHRLPADVLIAKLLGVPLTAADELLYNYSGLTNLIAALETDPEKFKLIYGIGDKRLEEMKRRVKTWKEIY
jgi:ERCC4-type nuclease